MDRVAPLAKGMTIAGGSRLAISADTPTEFVIIKRKEYEVENSVNLESVVTQLGLQGDTAMAVQVFVVVFVALALNLIVLRVMTHIVKRVKETKNFWDDVLVLAARKPISILIWMVGISWAADIVAAGSDAAIFGAIAPIREMSVIVLLVWFVVDFIKRAEQELIKREVENEEDAVDETTVFAIGKLLRLSVIITASLVMLQTLGYSISGVLAFGGIGGIAIGFAAKDLLANFFGGLMVYLDRPFAVGDWVRSSDRSIEGTVEHIGWRLTRIRTFDKRPLYVPNAIFANITVENPSRMTNRRIYETIGLRYQDSAQLEPIINDVKAMLQAHDEIASDLTMIVNFNAYGPSSLDFFVYTFTKTTDWVYFHEVKQDVLLKILAIIAEHGADVAFPTSTVHIPEAVHLESEALAVSAPGPA